MHEGAVDEGSELDGHWHDVPHMLGPTHEVYTPTQEKNGTSTMVPHRFEESSHRHFTLGLTSSIKLTGTIHEEYTPCNQGKQFPTSTTLLKLQRDWQELARRVHELASHWHDVSHLMRTTYEDYSRYPGNPTRDRTRFEKFEHEEDVDVQAELPRKQHGVPPHLTYLYKPARRYEQTITFDCHCHHSALMYDRSVSAERFFSSTTFPK
ncbi:hypothetical protein BJ508DRAFT_310558 [Ascobolus immersus RN42]|uniref:Uncharacterized protein n=1 Tax=Ascobolus immersus RN42 TaxID=1160509 RepID=A0A3N4HYJ8_ASCIM|nr:hypothetical protein BJ508DRAFT_310558 [Ascobolus immersus RN42]